MRNQLLHRSLMATSLLLALAQAQPARAQFLRQALNAVDQIPEPLRLGRDVVEERLYERRLQHNQARLQQDLSQGNTARAQHDLRRIQTDQYFVDRYGWKIQRDSFQNPGPFNYPGSAATAGSSFGMQSGSVNPVSSPAHSAQVVPQARQVLAAPAAVSFPVTVSLAGPAGTGPAYLISGNRYTSVYGQPQQFQISEGAEIEYDRGGTFGKQRYSLTSGRYEFRPSEMGWAFYKLP